jgi:hypothetical protein
MNKLIKIKHDTGVAFINWLDVRQVISDPENYRRFVIQWRDATFDEFYFSTEEHAALALADITNPR